MEEATEVEKVFPVEFYQRLQRPEFNDLLLIDALDLLSPRGASPLDVSLSIITSKTFADWHVLKVLLGNMLLLWRKCAAAI